MPNLQQMFRQLQLSLPACAHSFGHQAVQVSDMREALHAALPPTAAYPHTYGGEAIQMPAPGMREGVLAAVQSTEPQPQPHDGQTVSLQLMLQVLWRRAAAERAHPQAFRDQTHQDAYLSSVWEGLHPGNVSGAAHVETQCRPPWASPRASRWSTRWPAIGPRQQDTIRHWEPRIHRTSCRHSRTENTHGREWSSCRSWSESGFQP